MNQDITDLIKELPSRFVQQLEDCTSVKDLLKLKKKHQCYNRIAVIDARLENLRNKQVA